VIDSDDVLADPAGVLSALCEALGIPFEPAMLHWAPGRRETDGVWAPAWYDAVERSTGFAPPPARIAPRLDERLNDVVAEARHFYERLARYRIGPRAT
jgi:hypothetical protein